jgi:hypothetical protein
LTLKHTKKQSTLPKKLLSLKKTPSPRELVLRPVKARLRRLLARQRAHAHRHAPAVVGGDEDRRRDDAAGRVRRLDAVKAAREVDVRAALFFGVVVL